MIPTLIKLLEIVMNYFEDELMLDDMEELTAPEHIEWNNDQLEEFSLEALDSTEW